MQAVASDDLWLTKNLKHAELVRTELPGLPRSLELFTQGDEVGGFDALAGLRPWLSSTVLDALPGATVLDGQFTSVQQAIGTPRSRGDGGASMALERFIGECKASGLVEELITKHGVIGKLHVAG